MSESVRLVLAVLACYRLAFMLAKEDGPFGLFGRLRARFVHGTLAELLRCPYCLGVWLALPLVALVLWPTLAGDVTLTIFGIAGGQSFLQSVEDRDGT